MPGSSPTPPDPRTLRQDGRAWNELRPISLEPRPIELHPASCLARFGKTWVLCTASVAEGVPPFLDGSGRGWVTGQYAMMPGSVAGRIAPERNRGGRAEEITRLIGRSLRAAVDLGSLGSRTITVDCQVMQADGGTRTAAITGGFVALALALQDLHGRGLIAEPQPVRQIGAVSVGIVDGEAMLDLAAAEDTRADADMNVVMTSTGQFVEVQGTAEGEPFDAPQLEQMLRLAQEGIVDLLALQRRTLLAAG